MLNGSNALTKIECFNIPSVIKIGDQLMLSAKDIYNIAYHNLIPFSAWFKSNVLKNPLTVEFDDYERDKTDPSDYLISINLAMRILLASKDDEAYNVMNDLKYVDIQHETGMLVF